MAVPDDACVFITSGRLTPGKGFELFFRAFAEVHRRRPATRLAIAGSGTPEYEAQLQGLARDLGIEGVVIFLSWMAEGDLCACYNAADVGVMPGKLGGMKEILGVGRPLIAPDHLATAYLVERENGLTASPDDRASLATRDAALCRQAPTFGNGTAKNPFTYRDINSPGRTWRATACGFMKTC